MAIIKIKAGPIPMARVLFISSPPASWGKSSEKVDTGEIDVGVGSAVSRTGVALGNGDATV